MKVSYSVVSSGDYASSLHFRVIADDSFDPDKALAQIIDYPTTQPTLVYLHEQGAEPTLIETFLRNLKERFQCVAVLVTTSQVVTSLWYLVDRTIVRTTPRQYIGISANEVHLHYQPASDNPYPIPSPMGQTRFYVWTEREHYDDLIEWVRQSPTPMGIITRPM